LQVHPSSTNGSLNVQVHEQYAYAISVNGPGSVPPAAMTTGIDQGSGPPSSASDDAPVFAEAKEHGGDTYNFSHCTGTNVGCRKVKQTNVKKNKTARTLEEPLLREYLGTSNSSTRKNLARVIAIKSAVQQLTEGQYMTDDVLLAKLVRDASRNTQLGQAISASWQDTEDATKGLQALRKFVTTNSSRIFEGSSAVDRKFTKVASTFQIRTTEDASDPVEVQGLADLEEGALPSCLS
jgi:hypothetical protein